MANKEVSDKQGFGGKSGGARRTKGIPKLRKMNGRRRMGKCECCGGAVSGGGNRHKEGYCVPKAPTGKNHRQRKRAAAAKARRKASDIQVTRGTPVKVQKKKTSGG